VNYVLVGLFAGTSLLADPVAWVDRCLDEVAEQKESGPKRGAFKERDCMSIILNYCSFADPSETCYERLVDGFSQRAAQIIATLPEQVSGTEIQQNIYGRRLNAINNVKTTLQCREDMDALACDARAALFQYSLATGLPDLLARIEKLKPEDIK
jgi:hypothetical protein